MHFLPRGRLADFAKIFSKTLLSKGFAARFWVDLNDLSIDF